VIVVADDMGYSDLGCYGGEITTPDPGPARTSRRPADRFYNTTRCSPSRASMLTGLHPHQAGIGILTSDDRPDGYRGSLNEQCLTLAEMLREAGYATCLSGKWHLTSDVWNPSDAWPTRRGFDRFFGTLSGCGSYYRPTTLTRGEQNAESEAAAPGFFYTDAITDEADQFVRAHATHEANRPFFLYTAYTAPHWPLHAPADDVARYRGKFDAGWDELREARLKRLVTEGVMPAGTTLSGRDPTQPAVARCPRPAVAADPHADVCAQIDRMIAASRGSSRRSPRPVRSRTRSSSSCPQRRQRRGLADRGPRTFPPSSQLSCPPRPGPARRCASATHPTSSRPDDTYASYGRAWANLSNTPFRFYKRWVHEGGISTPLIVHWPGRRHRASISTRRFSSPISFRRCSRRRALPTRRDILAASRCRSRGTACWRH
jgi:arylsulfatase